MNNYYAKEESCESGFRILLPLFHCVSPENFELVFDNTQGFRDAMAIVAVCAKLCTEVKIITFELMNNHFHFIVSGNREDVDGFLELFRKRLDAYFRFSDRNIDFSELYFKMLPIDSLDYLRASIAYCNRNGYVVRDDETPFSYPWGANSCYFNPFHKSYYAKCARSATTIWLRSSIHGKIADRIKDLKVLDEYVSPFSFCDIESGERVFRDAKHYFFFVSKNVEWYQKISTLIGESVCYTDEDLFQVCCRISRERFNNMKVTLLPASDKIEIAKELHFKYNAGAKQIQRLLKLDSAITGSLF